MKHFHNWKFIVYKRTVNSINLFYLLKPKISWFVIPTKIQTSFWGNQIIADALNRQVFQLPVISASTLLGNKSKRGKSHLKMSAWFELWLKWAYYLTDLDLSMDLFALFIIRAAAGEIELKRRLEFNLGVIVSESYSWFGSVSKEKANFGTGGCQGSLVTLIQITGFCLRGDVVMDEVVAYGRRRSGFDPNDPPPPPNDFSLSSRV